MEKNAEKSDFILIHGLILDKHLEIPYNLNVLYELVWRNRQTQGT